MANVDKHYQLLASHPQRQIEYAYDGTMSNAGVGILVGGLAPLKDGVVISVLGEHGRFETPPHSMGIAGAITLSSADDYDGEPLIPLLENMIGATRRAIRHIRAKSVVAGLTP
ncbi:hypothetical protein CO665_02315 [Rhizobium anhuiense]|nr:hypothetical protein CO665_02315 [Rhizobium anhuiense]